MTSRRSWAAVDDAVLRQIARASIEQLAVFLATSRAPASPSIAPAATVAGGGRLLLGQIDDFRPEASGIFRIFGREPPAMEIGAAGMDEVPRAPDIPLPPNRPAPAAANTAAFAYSDPER